MYTFCTNKNSLTTLENGSQNMGEKKKKKEKIRGREKPVYIICHKILQLNTTKLTTTFKTIAFG